MDSDTIVENMVSVFPVPVGMTTVAISFPVVQWARIALSAPYCGILSPFASLGISFFSL